MTATTGDRNWNRNWKGRGDQNTFIKVNSAVIYEESGIKIDQVENLINQKKILYDHKADMKDKKYTAKTSLEKVSNEILPEYIFTNYDKYKEWLD